MQAWCSSHRFHMQARLEPASAPVFASRGASSSGQLQQVGFPRYLGVVVNEKI